MLVTVSVNDREYTRELEPRMLLVHFLRDELGLTGTHWAAIRRTVVSASC